MATPSLDSNFVLILPEGVPVSVVRETVNEIYDSLCDDVRTADVAAKVGSDQWEQNLGMCRATYIPPAESAAAEAEVLIKCAGCVQKHKLQKDFLVNHCFYLQEKGRKKLAA